MAQPLKGNRKRRQARRQQKRRNALIRLKGKKGKG